jgi:hypothetical protein
MVKKLVSGFKCEKCHRKYKDEESAVKCEALGVRPYTFLPGQIVEDTAEDSFTYGDRGKVIRRSRDGGGGETILDPGFHLNHYVVKLFRPLPRGEDKVEFVESDLGTKEDLKNPLIFPFRPEAQETLKELIEK